MALKINRTVTRITRIVGWGLIILILAAFTKVYIWEKTYYKRESATPRSDSVAVITKIPKLLNISSDEISSEEYEKHQVEAQNPRYLKIDRLHVDAMVTKGNVSNDGQLQYPSNINIASWYSGSSKPGNDGTILISGIREYKSADGIFKNLDSLESGDTISIITGDNSTFEYTVNSVTISANSEAESVLPNAQQRLDGKETLSLIGINDEGDSFVIIRATLSERSK